MHKIGVITGTRAEYGLLKPVIEKINEDEDLKLCLIATGMHLEEKFGYTYREIEKDGYVIDYKVEMNLESDTPEAVVRSMGTELQGFAEIFQKAGLDMIVVLGDRYEILMAATAAMIYRIPIAHIHGGELTEGLIDDAIRHSVTKMSAIHFASTDEYAKRIIQMGEQPQKVFSVGALGIENIRSLNLLSREALCERFGAVFEQRYMMVTYHPVTLEGNSAKWQFQNLLDVLSDNQGYNYVFTYANADPEGNAINEMIREYVEAHSNTKAFVSMGQLGYLSALKYCDAVVGNSSSGLIEAPSFNIPTVNIGNRQAGRVKADTVIDCGYSGNEIQRAFEKATDVVFRNACMEYVNPYEKMGTSDQIINEIKKYLWANESISKKFYDI